MSSEEIGGTPVGDRMLNERSKQNFRTWPRLRFTEGRMPEYASHLHTPLSAG